MTWVERQIAKTQPQAAGAEPPALFRALLSAGGDPELAYAATEEVKSWAQVGEELRRAEQRTFQPPALFCALLSAGCDPILAYAATEEVKSWAKRGVESRVVAQPPPMMKDLRQPLH